MRDRPKTILGGIHSVLKIPSGLSPASLVYGGALSRNQHSRRPTCLWSLFLMASLTALPPDPCVAQNQSHLNKRIGHLELVCHAWPSASLFLRNRFQIPLRLDLGQPCQGWCPVKVPARPAVDLPVEARAFTVYILWSTAYTYVFCLGSPAFSQTPLCPGPMAVHCRGGCEAGG